MRIRNIILIISKNLNFDDQIRLRMCHKFLYQNVRVKSIPYYRMEYITNDNLKSLIYLEKIILYRNDTITDEGVKNLNHLTSLDLWGNHQITDEGIKNLNHLTFLDLTFNGRITDEGIKNFANLREINAYDSKISQSCINKLRSQGCDVIG